MKAHNINTMTRRRTRRPDGGTYRDLRKRSGSGRRGQRSWLVIVLLIAIVGVAAWYLLRR